MKFNNEDIWGFAGLVEVGPIGSCRQMRETVPGVAGYRIYELGADSVIWHCEGRLVAFSREDLAGQIWKGTNYRLRGGLYTFTSRDGQTYDNCQLVSYEPIGRPQGVTLKIGGSEIIGATVRVRGIVSWCAPEPSGLGDAATVQVA